MKANRGAVGARWKQDEEAVSTVLGAILVAAIFVAFLVVVRVTFVPRWGEEAEASHMRLVERQLVTLKGELDRQVDNRSQGAILNPVSLGVDRVSVLEPSQPLHSLRFNPSSRTASVSSNQLLIQTQNGTSYVGASETWEAVTGGEVSSIAEVLSLRLRLVRVSDNNNGDRVTIRVDDAGGSFAGNISVYVTDLPSGYNINVRVVDASGAELYDQGVAFEQQDPKEPFWVNCLSDDYRFGQVLGAATKPLKLTLTEQNVDNGGGNEDLDASYAITYRQSTGEGSVVVGGGGIVQFNYAQTYQGGFLQLQSRNLHYPDQDLIIENGAVIINQAEGAVFKVDPQIDAALVGSTTSITIGLPSLVGDDVLVTGTGTATVTSLATRQTTLIAQAPRLNLTVQTAFPALWSNFFTAKLDPVPGFDAGQEFAVSSTATTATVLIYGLTTDPNSTSYDLFVTFRQADIDITLKG